MKISDRVYKKVNIDDNVLIELIDSKPMQRLKGVNQAGASKFFLNKPVSRYEHCVGVMILLKKMNAKIDEQIAGLLHDVAHTAFSHVIDFVFPNKNHDFHERFHKKILLKSEIPQILKKYGFDIHHILDERNFPLLEKNIPDLCADRVDYTFRDMIGYVRTEKAVEHFSNSISNIIVHENEIIIKGFRNAAQLTLDYLFMNEWVWARPLEVASFHVLGQAIRIAFDKGIIEMDDFFQDDDYIYKKLVQSNDKDLLQKISVLNPRFRIKLDKNDYDFFCSSKQRFIDPKFVDGDGSVKRVSEVSETMKKEIERHRKFVEDGFYVKVLG